MERNFRKIQTMCTKMSKMISGEHFDFFNGAYLIGILFELISQRNDI